MKKVMPIGISDFKTVINEQYFFIDKTLFIKDIIDNKTKILLITRPRRFGKTINMSMLKYYFGKSEEDNSSLFDKLNINNVGDKYKSELGKYPIIYITLKDTKFTSWAETYEQLKEVIRVEFNRHSYLFESKKLNELEKNYIKLILNRDSSATEVDYMNSLKHLTFYLNKHHGINPILLIDEYDIPIQSGFMNDFYEKIMTFMRNWLSLPK